MIAFSPDSPDEKRVLVDGLRGPAGLTAADGALYVADNLAGTLHRIGDDGAELVAEGLDQPEGLAAANGSIYVVEAGSGLVTAINPANGRAGDGCRASRTARAAVRSLPEHDAVQWHCHRRGDSLGRG